MPIVKTAVQQQWNIVYKDDPTEHLIEEAGRQIAKEIDFGVMCSLLVDIGWTKVELDSLRSNANAIYINEWLHIECKQEWKHQGRLFVFESKDEAALFKLTWS